MTPEQFDKILSRRLDLTRTVLGSKAKEYAAGEDRLHNFHAAGRLLGTAPEAALLGFLTKHLVSVVDLVKALPGVVPPRAYVDEKVGDCINYLILLEALLSERRQPENCDVCEEEVPDEAPSPCAHEWTPSYTTGVEFCQHCLRERRLWR